MCTRSLHVRLSKKRILNVLNQSLPQRVRNSPNSDSYFAVRGCCKFLRQRNSYAATRFQVLARKISLVVLALGWSSPALNLSPSYTRFMGETESPGTGLALDIKGCNTGDGCPFHLNLWEIYIR